MISVTTTSRPTTPSGLPENTPYRYQALTRPGICPAFFLKRNVDAWIDARNATVNDYIKFIDGSDRNVGYAFDNISTQRCARAVRIDPCGRRGGTAG